MRKVVFSVFVTLIFLGTAANAQIRIEFPLLRQLGVRTPEQNFVVTNSTPFSCDIVAYGSKVANLPPGETFYDNRRWEPLTPEIPLVALCYRGSTYVGATAKKLRVSRRSNSLSWIIYTREIRAPDGDRIRHGYGYSVYPTPETTGGSRAESIPRKWWNATSGSQLTNNTFFRVKVLVNGREYATIETGEAYYLEYKHVFGNQTRNSIQLLFLDGDRLVGTRELRISTTRRGVRADQHILGPHSIRQ